MKIKAYSSQMFVAAKKYLYVLLIPILQNLNFINNLNSLITLIGSEALLLMALLIFCYIKGQQMYIVLNPDGICVHSGLILKRDYFINRDNISSINIKRQFILINRNIVILSINTEALSIKQSDVTIAIPNYAAKTIISTFNIAPDLKNQHKFALKFLLLSALATSSSVTGIIVILPIIMKLSKIFNRELSSELLQNTSFLVKQYVNIPKLFVVLLIIAVLGYITAFSFVFLANFGFSINRDKGILLVKKGLLKKQSFYFSVNSINALVLKSSPIMQLLKYCCGKITVAGFNIDKRESSLFIPCANEKGLHSIMRNIIPEFAISGKKQIKIQHSKSVFLGLIITFLPYSIILVATCVFCEITFSAAAGFFIMLSVIVILITVLHIKTCLFICKNGYVSFDKDIEFLSLSWFSVLRGKIITSRCALIRLTRFSYDKSGMCFVQLTVRSERSPQYFIRAINYADIVTEISQRYNFK